jgi:hypothetical protein
VRWDTTMLACWHIARVTLACEIERDGDRRWALRQRVCASTLAFAVLTEVGGDHRPVEPQN